MPKRKLQVFRARVQELFCSKISHWSIVIRGIFGVGVRIYHDQATMPGVRRRVGDVVSSQPERSGQPSRGDAGETQCKVEMQHVWKLLYGRRASGRPSSEFGRDRTPVRSRPPGHREIPSRYRQRHEHYQRRVQSRRRRFSIFFAAVLRFAGSIGFGLCHSVGGK